MQPIGKTRLITATSDSADAYGGGCIILAVQLSANSANLDCQLSNAVTDTGSDELVYNVLDGDCKYFDYSPIGGIPFGVGLTLDIQGSGGQVTVFCS